MTFLKLILKLSIALIITNILMAPSAYSKGHEKKYKFFRDEKTKVKNPFDLRDPFKRRSFAGKRKGKSESLTKLEKTEFSNIPTIDNVPLGDISIVGVLLGASRRAVAKVARNKNDTFILKEGMKLGENQAEIKAILPGGIVLVEKIRNIYDEDEYLETILPIQAE
jgi:Tfp pilus assembly protein PilP